MSVVTRPINGAYDFNIMFDLWKIIDDNNLSSNIYDHKGRSNTGVPFSSKQDDYLTSGTQEHYNAVVEKPMINIEIDLNLDRSKIKDVSYLNTCDIITEILKIPNLNKQLALLQVSQKQGDMYTVNNYHLQESIDGIYLKEANSGKVISNVYKNALGWIDDEFGASTLILTVPNQMALFNCAFIFNSDIRKSFSSFLGAPSKEASIDKAININTLLLENINSSKGAVVAMNTIVMRSIIEHRTSIKFSDTLFDRMHFSWSNRMGVHTTAKFSDIQMDPTFNNTLDRYNISFSANAISNKESNKKDPFNILKDNKVLLLDRSANIFDSLDIFEFTDSDKEYEKGLVLDNRYRSAVITTELNIMEVEKSPVLSDLKKICSDIYADKKHKLYKRFQDISGVFKRLTPGCTPADIEGLAYLFIKKYLISDINRPDPSVPPLNTATSTRTYFELAYGPFKEFAGSDNIYAFHTNISKLNIPIYSFTSGRIENSGSTTRIYDGHFTDWRHMYTGILPYSFTGSLSEQRSSYLKNKIVIVVNDSLTKQSWKASTREYLKDLVRKNVSPDSIRIFDIQDKIELMMFKRIAKNYPGVHYYSEFSKSIKKKGRPARSSQIQNITYYKEKSFSPGVKKPAAYTLTDGVKNKIFVEFILTKNLIVINGNSYSFNEFSIDFWDDIIARISGAELCLVSTLNFKKLKEKDDFISLDTFLQNEVILEKLREIRHDFIVVHPKLKTAMNSVVSLMLNEMINPMVRPAYKSTFLNHPEIHSVHMDILNSFTGDYKVLYSNIYRTYARALSITTAGYNLSKIVQSYIKMKPDMDSPDWILYQLMGELPDDKKINAALGRHQNPNTMEFVSNNAGKLFNIEALAYELDIVLKHRNNLNLSIEQTNANINQVMFSFYKRAQLVVEILET